MDQRSTGKLKGGELGIFPKKTWKTMILDDHFIGEKIGNKCSGGEISVKDFPEM